LASVLRSAAELDFKVFVRGFTGGGLGPGPGLAGPVCISPPDFVPSNLSFFALSLEMLSLIANSFAVAALGVAAIAATAFTSTARAAKAAVVPSDSETAIVIAAKVACFFELIFDSFIFQLLLVGGES
jgi:hypothetical protein